MKKITLEIKLTLIAPFLTKSTDVGAFGLDYPLARNEDGKFFFPKKLIKGCLKQAWNEIANVPNTFNSAEVEKWLGKKSKFENEEDLTTVEPVRGKIYFSDFITNQTGDDSTTTRISIDNDRGAVDEGALLIIESPFEPQTEVGFDGKIIYFAEDDDQQTIKNRILKGLKWITNLGALENINFGRLEKVALVNEASDDVKTNISLSTGENYLDLIITPQEPFCISKRRTTANLFESEIFIPGGAIKGTLAETLKLIGSNETEFAELRDNLHLIRFTHAFPSKNNKRPQVVPLSFVKIKSDKGETDFTKKYKDVWEKKDAVLIHSEAPAFSVDWKDSSDIEQEFGWEKLQTILSVQTAIENNKAKGGDLYGYEKINPKGFQWLGRIDLSRIEDEVLRTIVEGQLRCVFAQDLFGLGKTKALAKAEVLDENTIKNKFDKSIKAPAKTFIITLQTPFLLCDPRNLNESSGNTELRKSYKETWEKLFGNSITLRHFFASQSLAGGEYLYKRFQADKPYNPFILTDAGSVFVFDVNDETEANKKVDDWLKHGLSLPDWAKKLYGNNWETCPFLPENGYGEISVNLDVHWHNAPKPTEVTEI
jgi:hypothetical protein